MRYFKIIILILWMILIFIMSSFNGEQSSNQSNFIVNLILYTFNITSISNLSFIIRKLAHFTEYLILGILTQNVFPNKPYLSILIGFIYACSDEFHQLFITNRSAQITDVLIDLAGVITGVLIFTIILNKHKYKIKNIVHPT